jgi:predicted nucleotidyltransferase
MNLNEMIQYLLLDEQYDLLNEKAKSDFEKLKDNKVALTDDERAQCMSSKAVWHFHPSKKATPAVWKSVHPETKKVTFVTNTHRAYNTAPTLKGAISRFHSFIKSTA